MSFGDPNNPYSQPPQQPQGQGYGYPQQSPGTPGYGGYPPPPPAGPYGAGPAPSLSGTVSAARTLLWVIAGLQLIGVIICIIGAVGVHKARNDSDIYGNADAVRILNEGAGVLWGFTAFAAVWLVIAAALALNFGSGGNGLRVGIMVFAILTAILGLYPFVFIGLVHTVLGILIACFVGGSNGANWFNRPRY